MVVLMEGLILAFVVVVEPWRYWFTVDCEDGLRPVDIAPRQTRI